MFLGFDILFLYFVIAVVVFVHCMHEIKMDYESPKNAYEKICIVVYCTLRAVLWFVIIPYMIYIRNKD